MSFLTFGFKSLRNLYKIQLSSLNGVKPKNYVHRFPAAFDDGFFVVVNNGRFSPLLSGHAIEKLLIEGNKVGIVYFTSFVEAQKKMESDRVIVTSDAGYFVPSFSAFL